MPQMGVSVSEGTVVTWRKQVGEHDQGRRDDRRDSTDKVDTEVPSPGQRNRDELLVPEGETVDVGTRIAVIDTGAAWRGRSRSARRGPAAPWAPAAAPRRGRRAAVAPPTLPTPHRPPPPMRRTSRRCLSSARAAPARRPAPTATRTARARPALVHVARRRAHGRRARTRHQRRSGTGRGGRVTKKDVEVHLAGGATARRGGARCARPRHRHPRRRRPARRRQRLQAPTGATPRRRAAPPSPAKRSPRTCQHDPQGDRAQHAQVGRHGGARHHVFEVDMTRCWAVRKQRSTRISEDLRRQGLVPAVHHARHGRRDPSLAVGQRGDARRQDHRQAATSTSASPSSVNDGKELVVPVIHSAEEHNLVGLTRALTDLAERARTKQLTPDEMSGGTFTLTNPAASARCSARRSSRSRRSRSSASKRSSSGPSSSPTSSATTRSRSGR